MTQQYEIKPLRWNKNFYSWQQSYRADTPFGSYVVSRHREYCDDDSIPDEQLKWNGWQWSYCFCEYYDESTGTHCKSAAEGKEKANEAWVDRLVDALKKTD